MQARIPRSPLSVAQELLPNFPSQMGHSQNYRQMSNISDDEYIDLQQAQGRSDQQQQTPHQFHMSLQQHIQQQLQQQFQRQLQLNLQGGDSARGEPVILPEPPDTVVDVDDDGTENSDGVRRASGGRFGSALSGMPSNSSRGLLETLLRSAQVATSSSHQNSNNNSSGGGRGIDNSSISQENNGAEGGAGIVGLGRGNSVGGNSGPASLSLAHAHHQYLYHGNGEGDGIGPSAGPSASGGGMSQGNRGGGAASQGVQQPAELTLLYKWAAGSGIFILLLLLHFLYDHRLGLLVFLCLGGTFYYTNMKLVHAIHQSAVREQSRSWFGFLNLIWLCGFLILNIFILYYVFGDQKLWRILFFQMASVEDISVWTLLWCVVMTDYIIKFLTIISKSILAMLQPLCKNYRRRGKYYLLIESISQLYRQVVTVVPWLYYLNDSTRTSMWFAFITEAVYLGFKSFGTKPSSSDILERGSQCPICQDTVNEPVMLPCKHIFCEQCVTIWFDREKTCPMCRAEITTESPMWKDGNTSSHLQWH
ncbi:RING finger and transmembrane domain-containing protein 2-like [Elysia marginata]|uniref:RING finger and transmembrane domain-containing protein 2-like n=1 Tax=Elysia marginata TaxID=1093978 RepID=A0AAV4EB32_9GAST|nr:RING finger and transmembrane domain-containing protein 2-like [Elysia marginata]